jgi:radical SAM protein with 4Fe4S-binding SPASM domain
MNDYNLYHGKIWNTFTEDKWEKFLDKTDKWKCKLLEMQGVEISSTYKINSINHFYKRSDMPKKVYKIPSNIWYELTSNLSVLLKYFGKFGMPDNFVKYLNERQNYQYKITNIQNFFPRPCPAGLYPSVLSNGEITCCCLDTEGTLSLGNIENTTLEQALSSKKRMQVFKHPERFQTCRKCRGWLVFFKK